jgi:class 3 adenylate cyclase
VRVGIATGLAAVGDLIGEGAAQERGVVGETPNLAARLQALATPNTLVIAEATRWQIGCRRPSATRTVSWGGPRSI